MVWVGLSIVIFTVGFIYRNSAQFKEARSEDPAAKKKANSQWHIYQAFVQFAFFFCVYLASSFWFALLGASVFWLAFDIGINVVGLNVRPFRVGTTAFLDRFIRNHFTDNDEIEYIVIKVVCILVSLLGLLDSYSYL